jgi:hypothetical protein
LKLRQLQVEVQSLAQENRGLRSLLERSIEHRMQSHNQLVLLITDLVSRLPLNDVGVLVAKLVEHNNEVGQYLASLIGGPTQGNYSKPELLKTLDQNKQDLADAIKPLVEELVQSGAPLDPEMLRAVAAKPELFFSPPVVRATRGFVKGQVPRERVLTEFGDAALVLFTDMTTDPKLNPRPKKEEILLAFRNDYESILAQDPALLPDKREKLRDLQKKILQSKVACDNARAQRTAFQKLTFLLELLHFYQNPATEAPDVLFAQRLPSLLEQLVILGPQDPLDEKMIALGERMLGYIVNAAHRRAVVNNLGKGNDAGKTLKYVLRLRSDGPAEADQVVPEFVKHLIPAPPQRPPTPEALAPILRLLSPQMERRVIRTISSTDRMRKDQAEALAKALCAQLGLGELEQAKPEDVPPEVERQLAWGKIKDLIARRSDPVAIAAAFRDRLRHKYDADELRQSWITLTESDPLALIRIFCSLPYLEDGRTDPIARTVMETYITRLTHEKYATTYRKVITSLKNLYHAKADSPTLMNFLALTRWVDPESAAKIMRDTGMPPSPG